MAGKHLLMSRLTRIVELFQINGENGLTYEEVNERLFSMQVDENLQISLRTFQRDLKDIATLLNVHIVYDRTKRKYVLQMDGFDNQLNNHRRFVLDGLKMFHIAQDALSSNFVYIKESKASGLEYYPVIKKAIVNQKYLHFAYQKFDQYKSNNRKMAPQLLIENKKRWYVVGYEERNGKLSTLKTFALDRFQSAEIGRESSLIPAVNVKKHFKDFYGVGTLPLEGFDDRVDVEIETSIEYGKYFRTLPLHESQIITIVNGKTQIKFQIIPTMEFIAELLSHNFQIKVIKPFVLVDSIKKILEKNLSQYL